MVIGLILFAVLGFTLGYAVQGRAAWFALAVPVAFAVLTAYGEGIGASLLVVLLIALAVTAAAVLAGKLLDRRFSGQGEATS